MSNGAMSNEEKQFKPCEVAPADDFARAIDLDGEYCSRKG
jgi:hypothetical protein